MSESDLMNNETRIHPETGEVLRRDVRPFEFTFRGETITVNMPGRYPAGDGDAIFTHEDLQVSERALENLKIRQRNSA